MTTKTGGLIFRDVPDDIDESWRHGVLVGGMASAPDDAELARSYAEAAVALIDAALGSGEAWQSTNPVFYQCRHAIELRLKAVFRPKNPTHALRPLIDRFEAELYDKLQEKLPVYLKNNLEMFAYIDPFAESFRFSHEKDWTPKLLPGEYWLELDDLRQFVQDLFEYIGMAERRLHLRVDRQPD